MKTQPLGDSPLLCSRLAYGCWRIAGADDPHQVTQSGIDAGRRAVAAAYDAGYTLFDTADIYTRGMSETILGLALKDIPAMRGRVVIATKCGIIFPGDPRPDAPHRYDFSAGHIVWSCEQSLKRLGIETIDLFHLHRPDVLMDPQEVAGAFDTLRRQGKAREFAVSNFLPSTVDALAAACPMPLVANQVEVHLGRLDCFYDGTLDQCLRKKMTPLAWSPLGGGWLGGAGDPDPADPRLLTKRKLLGNLGLIAERYCATRTAIALAWLLKHPSRMIPIVGSINPEHIRAATKAAEIELSREDWYRLLNAARAEPLP